METALSLFVKHNWRKLLELPPPGEEWPVVEQDEWFVSRSDYMERIGAIHKAGFRHYDDHSHHRVFYETNEQMWERVQKYKEVDEKEEGFLPCGHDGFRNLRDSEHIECKKCKERFTKAEV